MGDINVRKYQHRILNANLKRVREHGTNPLTYHTAKELLLRSEETFAKFEVVQSKLIATAVDESALDVQEEEGWKVEQTYQSLRSGLRPILETLQPAGPGPSISSVATAAPLVRLPAMELPTFDGNLAEWTSFTDLFFAAIGSHKTLGGAQKLQYLKSSLRGEPAAMVKSLATTDGNYTVAWNMLNDRYNNKKEIVQTLVNKMLDIKPVKNENASELQIALDEFSEYLRSLEVLSLPVVEWDAILVVVLLRKLDGATRREWAIRQTSTELPKLSELQTFLRAHIRGLLSTESKQTVNVERRERPVKVHVATTGPKNCLICNGDHPQYQCTEFKLKTVEERNKLAVKHKLCFNCLSAGHNLNKCTWKGTCRQCGKKHHSLLHAVQNAKGSNQERKSSSTAAPGQGGKEPVVNSHHITANPGAILMTAVVFVEDVRGTLQTCRVFVDPGSEAEFISEECCRRLGLARESNNVTVSGFGETRIGTARGFVTATLSNRNNKNKNLTMQLLVMSRLTGAVPSVRCKKGYWPHLEGIELADPRWYQPDRVDIMIGVKQYHKVTLDGKVTPSNGDEDAPVAWNSIFGYLVSGSCPVDESSIPRTFHISVDPVVNILQKFWEIEEIPETRELTEEETKCEEHFKTTHRRDGDGRFIVRIPFNNKVKDLGSTRELAIQRFRQVERRMNRDGEYKRQYIEFMEEYEKLGHMTKISLSESEDRIGKTAYLPHHGVINESSSTTKLRVVFDGSASSTHGISLNQTMMVGATLQKDLFDILLKFRMPPIVLKADIAKMFRQFKLHPDDIDYHRIVWRKSPDENLSEYRLMTVTYGTACAPFLATRCLMQLAEDCAKDYPAASVALRNHAYVDDILVGESTVDTTIMLFNELLAATRTAGLDLRKWTTNDPVVLEAIPEELREMSPHSFDDEETTVKALGIQWHPRGDIFKFKGVEFKYEDVVTKRNLLSDASRCFDPLGLISCVSVRAKILLQESWKSGCGWDDQVPDYIQQQWTEYTDDLKLIPSLTIPRKITITGATTEIHGFSDSSERALGANLYVRNFLPNGNIVVNFITSKSRVAPVKYVSLPRLELEAAVLLAKLVKRVVRTLELEGEIVLWTDSMITLTWISGSPHRWKTYVANRVSKIQKLTDITMWRHVPGTDNPADLSSRGARAKDIIDNNFWWKGPAWLSEPGLPGFRPCASVNTDLEERPTVVSVHHIEVYPEILERYSTLLRVKRVTAYVRRYIHNCRQRKTTGNTASILSGPLTVIELQQALLNMVRITQQQYFNDDMQSLRNQKKVGPSSKLKSLHPYIDNDGILRVSGRIVAADLLESRKHQIILPSNSRLTWILVYSTHVDLLHSGFQVTWARLQSEYWILQGRNKVRHFIRGCVRCRRYKAKAAQQLMGNLPLSRVTPSRAFTHTGVDYAGPFLLKNPIGRAPKSYKGYLCLFVCMATKAVHLEPVSSLCTEGFLQCLRRFVSRRGLCAHLYSDCGTNFVGAEKELKEFLHGNNYNDEVANEMSQRGIQWHFNAPSAPHQGGLWEAAVKSAKYHIRRIMGNNLMTYEHFHTVLCQIEAVLNSRPLYAQSSEPDDLEALTPGHFLIGEPLVAVPACDMTAIPQGRLSQFHLQVQRVQHFWKRWSAEYLNTLQQRNKWRWEADNVKIGDLVLIIEECSPGNWKMGRVIEIFKGNDELVRVASVKTASGQIKRSITKLIPLLSSEIET